MRLSRRSFVIGTAAAALGGAELAALAGRFDHRTLPAPAGADPSRAAEALGALAMHEATARALHLGHSTHLLRLGASRVLTDPWFFDPAHGGMRHAAGLALAPERVGALDAIVITHEHPDHADPRALDRLDKRAHVIVATEALRALARRLGFAAATVLQPWQSLELRGLAVHAVPALHDVYEIGFVLERGGDRVYFAGDTRVHLALDELRERHRPTAAILPIDATGYRFGHRWVMTPEEAADTALRLGVRTVMPTHHEARFADPLLALLLSRADDPLPRLRRRLATLPRAPTLVAPAIGAAVAL